MRAALATFAIVAGLLATTSHAAEGQAMKELAPSGRLRAGVAYAPNPTPVFVVKDGAGVRGVAADLSKALASALGAPVDFTIVATTGELTDLLRTDRIDIGFMPVDDERRTVIDFAPSYFQIENTYLVAANAGISSFADVDRADVTVVGIDGSTTIRATARILTKAKLIAAKSVGEAMAIMKDGKAQAFVLTQDSLPALQSQLPASRILPGAFRTTGVAIAIQKNKPAALAFVNDFTTKAKADGTIRRAFDSAGLNGLKIAP